MALTEVLVVEQILAVAPEVAEGRSVLPAAKDDRVVHTPAAVVGGCMSLSRKQTGWRSTHAATGAGKPRPAVVAMMAQQPPVVVEATGNDPHRKHQLARSQF